MILKIYEKLLLNVQKFVDSVDESIYNKVINRNVGFLCCGEVKYGQNSIFL